MAKIIKGFWPLCLALALAACFTPRQPSVDDGVAYQQQLSLKGTLQLNARSDIDRIVVFGDSLSDGGRLRQRTLFFFPADDYWQGRASNGPLWIDYAIGALNWPLLNYAVAGATTDSDSWIRSQFVPPLPQQIAQFLDEVQNGDRKRTLAVLWIGPNNYLSRPENEDAEGTIRDLREALQQLRRAGLRTFMIGTMPELGGLPAYQKSPRQDQRLHRVTAAHNKRLNGMIESLRSVDRDMRMGVFQAFAINQETLEKPSAFGFRNMREPCLSETICKDPAGYKFWDAVHPTSKMHCYYAVQFLADLKQNQLIQELRWKEALDRCQRIGNRQDSY